MNTGSRDGRTHGRHLSNIDGKNREVKNDSESWSWFVQQTIFIASPSGRDRKRKLNLTKLILIVTNYYILTNITRSQAVARIADRI